MASLQAALEQQGQKLDAFIASTDTRLKNIEEHAERNTAILQEMMAMMLKTAVFLLICLISSLKLLLYFLFN